MSSVWRIEEEPGLSGDAKARIANGIVRLHARYYGRGPTRARTHADGAMVAVVLEETFTVAERTLIARGETDEIRGIRRRFQQVMGDQFKAVVERETGREVVTFMSETDVERDVAVEIFLLGEPKTEAAAGAGEETGARNGRG